MDPSYGPGDSYTNKHQGPYRETVFSTSGGGGGKCHQLMRLKVTIFGAKITPRAKLALWGRTERRGGGGEFVLGQVLPIGGWTSPPGAKLAFGGG